VQRSERMVERHVHTHDHPHEDEDHGHSHGLIHESIKRSRAGIQAVSLSLAVLGLAAMAQTAVFLASGSVALLADLIHNFGDALTAVPLGIAFALRKVLLLAYLSGSWRYQVLSGALKKCSCWESFGRVADGRCVL